MYLSTKNDYEFKKIFTNKYFDIATNYVELIQSVLNDYDIVIFMARKAYCFYLALKKANLIKDTDCKVFSSRALSFSNIAFYDKKTAIIEDVVIKGISLTDIVSLDCIRKVRYFYCCMF